MTEVFLKPIPIEDTKAMSFALAIYADLATCRKRGYDVTRDIEEELCLLAVKITEITRKLIEVEDD